MRSNYFNLTVVAVFMLAFIIYIPGIVLDLIFFVFSEHNLFSFYHDFLNGTMITLC